MVVMMDMVLKSLRGRQLEPQNLEGGKDLDDGGEI